MKRVAWAALAAVACSPATTYRELGERRQPDGVTVDPATGFGAPQRVSHAAEGVVLLRTPPEDRVVLKVVTNFLEAVTREDVEAARGLMTSDCHQLDPERGARENAINTWARRFARLDYTPLESLQFYDVNDFRLLRNDDFVAEWPAQLGDLAANGLPPSERTEASDVLVVVPISLPNSRQGRLLGPTLSFLLRRNDGGFVIHRVVEDFPLTR